MPICRSLAGVTVTDTLAVLLPVLGSNSAPAIEAESVVGVLVVPVVVTTTW